MDGTVPDTALCLYCACTVRPGDLVDDRLKQGGPRERDCACTPGDLVDDRLKQGGPREGHRLERLPVALQNALNAENHRRRR
eukprot:6585099-Pyramimonas_sp.AAC.1